MKTILASASPRRQELLRQLGLRFTVERADCAEAFAASDPAQIVSELAMRKARNVGKRHGGERILIIGADTIVVMDGRVLGKPADTADAYRMLTGLSGRTHQVYTGTALLWPEGSRVFAVCTDVTFYPLTEEEIRSYIASGDPFDKAGGYGIQSGAMKFVEKINGDYNNVVGLPVSRLYQEIKETGLADRLQPAEVGIPSNLA